MSSLFSGKCSTCHESREQCGTRGPCEPGTQLERAEFKDFVFFGDSGGDRREDGIHLVGL